MNILILSKLDGSYFSQRIIEEAKRENIDVDVFNPKDATLHHRYVHYNGKKFPKGHKLCLLRTPPYREDKDFFHLAGEIIEKAGCTVINSPSKVENAGNKFKTAILLKRANIPILPSVAVRKSDNLQKAVDEVGGFPVFLKTIYGTRGIGVIYCPCYETLKAASSTMWAYHSNVFIEKCATQSKGETVRILIFMNKVLGAVKNKALFEKGLMRSNFSIGGISERYTPSEEMIHIAQKSLKELGILFGGVDLIFQDGWKVLEVNSSPGIKGFEKTTKVNVAREILLTIKDAFL